MPSCVAPLTTFAPTASDVSAFSCVSDTMSDGATAAGCRCASRSGARATTYGVMPTTVPSTGA